MENSFCDNTIGGYSCICEEGFVLNSSQCGKTLIVHKKAVFIGQVNVFDMNCNGQLNCLL